MWRTTSMPPERFPFMRGCRAVEVTEVQSNSFDAVLLGALFVLQGWQCFGSRAVAIVFTQKQCQYCSG